MQATDFAKQRAAERALDFVEPGMVVGLGSGSTATRFIRLLAQRVRHGLSVRGIASSTASEQLAASLSIPMIGFDQCSEIDVTIDGADEIAPGLNLIKGGGGALLREKILASASKQFIIVADSRKIVDRLGRFPLPIEVIPMAAPVVKRKLQRLGLRPRVRTLQAGPEFITDEGNLILDCACGEIDDPHTLAASIRDIVGVVEHGFFLDMADTALIANESEVMALTR